MCQANALNHFILTVGQPIPNQGARGHVAHMRGVGFTPFMAMKISVQGMQTVSVSKIRSMRAQVSFSAQSVCLERLHAKVEKLTFY